MKSDFFNQITNFFFKCSKMEQQQLSFSNLPTEALFSFFCSLDPLVLGTYSTVCKKWAQMCRDNELWRQYCIERWDKNPKESDCAKNWLIPVRDVGGSKENRINWRRCYMLRSLYEYATKFFQLVPENKEQLGSLERKGKKASQANDDLFAKGWPLAEDLLTFEKRVNTVLTKISLRDRNEFDGDYLPDYTLLYLFLELELSILRRINISRVKYLGLAGRFLGCFPSISRTYPAEVPPRLAAFAEQYAKIAAEKDLPTDIISELLENIAVVFADLIINVVLPLDFSTHLTQFISVIILSSLKQLQNGLKQWAYQEEDLQSSSPTERFDKILLQISDVLTNKTGIPIFFAAIHAALGSNIETKEQILTMLSVISTITEGCEQYFLDNAKVFMASYILPYWKSTQDAEYLVPLLYYFAIVLSRTSDVIQTQFVNEIIPPLLEMAKHENHNVQREVANFIIGYCAYLNNQDTLVPYLTDLLEVLYRYFTCEYASVRKEAIFAVSSLIIACNTSFIEHKDRIMTEFKKLLANGDASDRKSVIEAITRIGAGIGDQKSSIEADIEVLYDQVVEDCKRDREAYIDLLLKMTDFNIVALGPKFAKHIPFVFPLLIENAIISVVEEKSYTKGAEQMEDNEEIPQFRKLTVLKTACDRKDAALGAILTMIREFDRTRFLYIHEGIGTAIQHIITNPYINVHAHIRAASDACCAYIQKLFAKGDPEWCTTERMMWYWMNSSNMFLWSVNNTELMQTRCSYVFNLTQIFKHFCSVSTPSQPFLTVPFVQHSTAGTFNALLIHYYQAEADRKPFHEVHDFGSEIIGLMEAVCATRTDQVLFWNFADPILQRIAGAFEQGLNKYRWLDASLIGTVFEHFGYEFLAVSHRVHYLHLLATCKDIRTTEMYQCLANHLGVMATKYPNLLPQDDNIDYLFFYLENLLIGEECQRDSGPAAYDNALMAMSGLVLFLVSLYEQTTNKESDIIGPRIKTHFATLTSALPPAANGDQEEALICITQYCHMLLKTQFYFQDENGAELKLRVIDALQQTLQMSAYDTPEVHQIVDPVLETLRAQ